MGNVEVQASHARGLPGPTRWCDRGGAVTAASILDDARRGSYAPAAAPGGPTLRTKTCGFLALRPPACFPRRDPGDRCSPFTHAGSRSPHVSLRGAGPIQLSGLAAHCHNRGRCSRWSAVHVRGRRGDGCTGAYRFATVARFRRYRRTTLRSNGPRSTASLLRSKSRPSRSIANMMRQRRWATAMTASL